ncbi:Chitinase A1 [Andreprevotia sp. IGB-42]|uniref:glycoside hydrolase family 18 protein n=1 Tax=Andreprevotia sp. IGB-42 TaxID=2497473 RepID=UPI00135879A2|nr:glycoside hydrolase family 18 protein [Andreprevotia sp. IGB-42]KAF0813601.1 Chitinase A1 [Andreprevotia sp. IGB-42]
MHSPRFNPLLPFAMAGALLCSAAQAAPLIISYLPTWQSDQDQQRAVEVLPKLDYGILSFLEVKPDGTAFVSDAAAPSALFWHQAFTEARKKNPALKCQWVIAGWEGSRNIAKVAQSEAARTRLAITATAIMRAYQCQGLDLDWEHPVTGGNYADDASPADKDNYILLLQALRAELARQGKNDNQKYVLTAALPVTNGGWSLSGYDIPRAVKELDWVNMMLYDFYGAWSARAGLLAPLYGLAADPDGKVLSIDLGIKYMLDKGARKDQLVFGLPFYFRAQGNVEPGPAGDGLNQPSKGPGLKQYKEPGAGQYYLVKQDLIGKPGWQQFRSKEAGGAPYLYNAGTREFVSYDDPQSLKTKLDYVKANGLAGVMIWELTQDDAQHSLFNTLTQSLR